ncbi:MAG: hypothetical protein LUO87_03975 [Methanomicrobiales archaeon]|nr:hypothetical protein [Methanomicrobiales archaeon]MDD1659926.1 hypothetical protein [Methanomicrobiales archaeon]
MFEFLKRLVKTGKAPATFTVDEVSTLLSQEKEKAQEAIREGVLAHRTTVLQAQEAIAALLPAFSPPRDLPESHPKLRSITEHSLPLFVKAMETAVARPIPEDPEGCYREGGEVLRSCLRTMQGQGRYLSSTHRQEMQQVREEVSRMGKAINAMTEVIATARRRMGEIDRVESAFQELAGTLTDSRKTASGISDLETKAASLAKEAGDAARSRDLLEAGEAFRGVQELTRRISLRESERDDTLREYQAVAAQAIHLFRKGEGSAQRAQDSTGADLFRAAREHLDLVPPPEAGRMRDVLAPAVARARELEKAGVLALKTADDRALILGEPGLHGRIAPLLARFHDLTREIGDLQKTRAAIPALAEHRGMQEQLRRLEKERAQLEEKLLDLRAHLQDRERELPPLRERLATALSALRGRPILVRE